MADPRFFDNKGPFTLAEICARAGASLPEDADPQSVIADVASLSSAGAEHLTFFSGSGVSPQFAQSRAGFCIIARTDTRAAPIGTMRLAVDSVQHAFADVAALFYPDHSQVAWQQLSAINPTARLGQNVVLGPGVVIGADA
ncbi:MAG TPA: LpxD N-terminal domain-containing protein, partial [Gemmataceae bacterium]|nr:LpxD N-terminal domain-containing protein [Gemmataceae bacterium]